MSAIVDHYTWWIRSWVLKCQLTHEWNKGNKVFLSSVSKFASGVLIYLCLCFSAWAVNYLYITEILGFHNQIHGESWFFNSWYFAWGNKELINSSLFWKISLDNLTGHFQSGNFMKMPLAIYYMCPFLIQIWKFQPLT